MSHLLLEQPIIAPLFVCFLTRGSRKLWKWKKMVSALKGNSKSCLLVLAVKLLGDLMPSICYLKSNVVSSELWSLNMQWNTIYFFLLCRSPKDLKTYGSWALVTGATDGIGKAFAYQLAETGLNLILVGRNYHKLVSVSQEFQSKFPSSKIITVVFDFSGNMLVGVEAIKEAIKGLDVGILINNVGITYPGATYFHKVDEKVWMNIVQVNLEGTTRVTRAVLPDMLKRKRGVIVNIGSGSTIVVPSHPLYTIYAATKAYIDQLSRCLHVEYKGSGIHIQCQVPLYVATKMVSKVASIEKASSFIPTADDYAEAAIRHLGYESRCTPYWAHWLQWCFASFIPDSILDSWRLSIAIHRTKSPPHY